MLAVARRPARRNTAVRPPRRRFGHHAGLMADFHAEPLEILRMRVDLRGDFPRPRFPDGSHVRSFHASDGPRLHALLEHGYRNGGGSVDAYDVWLPALTGDSEFAPELCFLVEAGDELVAAAVCWTSAFVKDIVVHETWRRHGLGEALLRLAFRTFQARRATGVELKVQAQNAPAIRLYERVGMRTVERISEP
jgi:GNAT superfamily N-acetyltransferase